MRALVIGHFSTIGDIESLEYVEDVLNAENVGYDVLPFNPQFAPDIAKSIERSQLSPGRYTHLIVVCGPVWPSLFSKWGLALRDFAHCTRIGVNLTMVEPLADWNPFHVLLERDSERLTRPDITLLRDTGRVPVAGLCTIGKQREYGERQRHAETRQLFDRLISTREIASMEIDTRWPAKRNRGQLRSPAEVISLIARTDVLLTNRLHGLVYALKAGIPALAIDSVAGGDKVTAQAAVLEWPAVSTFEDATAQWLDRTLDWCLSEDGRSAARQVAERAREKLQPTVQEFRAALRTQFDFKPVPHTSVSWKDRLLAALRLRR